MQKKHDHKIICNSIFRYKQMAKKLMNLRTQTLNMSPNNSSLVLLDEYRNPLPLLCLLLTLFGFTASGLPLADAGFCICL